MRQITADVHLGQKRTSGQRRCTLALAASFEQSERTTQHIRRRLALVVGHAVGINLKP